MGPVWPGPWAHSFVGPCWAIHLLGLVGAIHLLGPVGAIHLLGPVGPIHYVLQEIIPRWLQMKNGVFMENGVESKTPGESQLF